MVRPRLLAALRAAETAVAMLRPASGGRTYLEGASRWEMRVRQDEANRR